MKSKILDIRRADKNDCMDIWLWRNYPNARKNFFNTKRIPWHEHKKWFYSKIKNANVKIYTAFINKIKMGVLRFEVENDFAKVSINLNPQFYSMGLGREFIKYGTCKFIKENKFTRPIIAEIKVKNIASQKAFAAAGYKFTERKSDRVIFKKGMLNKYSKNDKMKFKGIKNE